MPLSDESKACSHEDSEALKIEADGSDMPHEARRVLVHLMRQGVIIASQNSKLFEMLCYYEIPIRRHLAEVYLQLTLDHKAGVAFVANFRDGGENGSENNEFSSLIARRTLSLFDTLVLLVLRKHYQERESVGEQKITIDIERLESYLAPFLPLTHHEKADRKKLNIAIQKFVLKRILSTTRADEDRYEITPVIRYVVNAEFLESMLVEYEKLAESMGCQLDSEAAMDDSLPTNQDEMIIE